MATTDPTSSAAPAPAAKPKRWKNLRWLLATLAMPLALAWVAHEFSTMEQKRAADDRLASDLRALNDGRLKAYSELLNKREESEMGVRSQLFSTLLGNYLSPTKGDLDHRMTVLGLLATNFDESLNLSPLFWQLDRALTTGRDLKHRTLREQLSRLATELKERQLDVLSANGALLTWEIPLSDESFSAPLAEKIAQFGEPGARGPEPHKLKGCKFQVSVLDRDPVGRRVYAVVRTDSTDPGAADSLCLSNSQPPEPKQWSFWVDEFDFPLINFTRLSETERFALVLIRYSEEQHFAKIGLVFFPSSRGGARDRPFLDTVVDSLNSPVEAPAAARTPR